MNLNLTLCIKKVTIVLVGIFIMALPTKSLSATDAEDYIAKLKLHYQKTLSIQAFAIKNHFLNRRYRSYEYWDHESPNLYMSQRVVEVDLKRHHFYDNDILYYSGGRLYDRVQFQNDTESYFYEKSATNYGKAVIKRGMDRFDGFIRHIVLNIDFLAVRALFEESKIQEKTSLTHDRDAGTTTITHKISDNETVEYVFRNAPLQLISINNSAMNGFFVYDNYQTTRGITYARSVTKYYDGAVKPTYITYNDDFYSIDKVDPAWLRLPDGYGPILERGDGVLVAKEISENLYLVTDSSEARNSLFKVNGDEITVFGAAGNSGVAEKTIKLIRDLFPDQKITSVHITHPHTSQIAGLKVFVDLGAEILADNYTIAAIKAFPRFIDDIDTFKFKTIKHNQVIDGAHFYVLENMHSKRQSFVLFKDNEIIFQARFVHLAQDNTIPKVIPNYTRAFINFIQSNDLKFSRIVGNFRNNNISVEVMNKISEVNM